MRPLFIASIIALLFYSCNKEGANSVGKGGSLSRFTISGNYLYIANNRTIETYDISNPAATIQKSSVEVNANEVETIYPYKNYLFIGSTTGMFIYSLDDPKKPELKGSAVHVRSCDPVVANDTHAFVTLRTGSMCGGGQDGLYIYNVQNVMIPVLKSTLPMSTPFGLGLKDSVLFVCRGTAGLSIVNVKNPEQPVIKNTLTDHSYIDVITLPNLLICYISNGIALYDISDLNNIVKVGSHLY